MDKDTVEFIYKYWRSLFTENEIRADRHYNVSIKWAGNQFAEKRAKMLKTNHWLTNDPEVLALLKDGFVAFKINIAKRILAENDAKIIFNNCPKCGERPRTPKAKQCRFCWHDWH